MPSSSTVNARLSKFRVHNICKCHTASYLYHTLAVRTLQAQLEGVKRKQNEREKRLTLETTIKVTALEQKHAAASTRLAQKAVNSAAQAKKLQADKVELVAYVQTQRQRLKQLELALGCKQLMDDLR
uniref:Uncharacterized protein n=1 Tax=Hyaloperonospora arabidopsidis (strain Emoy2) TaxID=559515 RepID=M4BXB1_HYAAE